jgi:lactate dehydrogenase-like 2-hydroxyacid dehydrogenase
MKRRRAAIPSKTLRGRAMNQFEVLVGGPVMPLIRDGLAAKFPVHTLYDQPDPEAFIAQNANKIKALVGGYFAGRVDGAFLSRFPDLKIIGNFGVGYDAVDAIWAGKNGIIVTNTPDVLNDEVADLAMGLLIATIRRLPQADRFVRSGQWLKGNFPLTGSLRGQTLGILGLGRIGKAIAKRAEAFGLKIAYHGRSQQPDSPYSFYPSLTQMAKDVDILLIIAPGGPGTQGIVNKEVLEALGPHGTLINVARGTLVDEAALVSALQSGKLGAAGLDVFEKEPLVPEALFGMENVVLLPHVGSGSHYTRNAMGQLVVDNIVSFAAGRGPLTPVAETPWRA